MLSQRRRERRGRPVQYDQVKHESALRLSEMAGVQPVARVYPDDGKSDRVCAIRSRPLQFIIIQCAL
jgi:hypothetical protein